MIILNKNGGMNMDYFDYFYCRKCGRISTVKPNDYSCDVCSTQMCRVPEQYLDSCGLMTEENEQIIFDKFIKNSSEYCCSDIFFSYYNR